MSEPCNCEAAEHFDFDSVQFGVERGHDYLAVPAGERHALYVGRICDLCADTHMKDYLYV
jgi:hypothetical protein